ncbi:MAG: hypothetical protein HGN29_18700 [Asgard group archaeon]|nr:hypothetical protein [Asgard group archaeon]
MSKKTILFLTFLLIFSVFSIRPKIVLSPTETTLHEETIEIYWDQGVVLNTSMVYNRGEVFLGFSVASYSNSSVLFSFVPATASCYSVNWTPVIENEIQLNPGESYSNNHSLKISDRGVGMFIRYFCTIPTVDSNATVTFATAVLNFGNKLSSIGFGLILLTSIITSIVYKYSQKKRPFKNL